MTPTDQYRYFRIEARELVEKMAQDALALERGAPDAGAVGRLLRHAHTLKGAARVVKQPEIADLAHAIEDELAPHRGGEGRVEAETASRIIARLDQIGAAVERLVPPPEPEPASSAGATAPQTTEPHPPLDLDTVRVEMADLDRLLELLAGISVRLVALGEEARHPELARGLADGVERADADLRRATELVSRLRLVPARTLFPTLERAVRDAAQALGKDVAFRALGGEQRIDAHVLAALRDGLLHVVRNAVAHGIEDAAQRADAGKPAQGTVELSVRGQGQWVTIECRDDGAGIDVDAVRRAAVEAGVIEARDAARLDDAQALQLALHGGVTTSAAVTTVAGRGIGLEVLRVAVAQLKGTCKLRSERGTGTSVHARVPITLSSLDTLAVEADGVPAAIPIDAVREVVLVAGDEVFEGGERSGGRLVAWRGRSIPFVPLAAAMGRSASQFLQLRAGRRWPTVVVEVGDQAVGLGVDQCRGIQASVVHAVPPLAGPVPGVVGASFDPRGAPVLVLEPASVVEAALGVASVAVPAAPPARPPVLVIDDSLTTRMVEQSLLETAGYEVDVAGSAEEAIELASRRRYGVFVVDVELPGMDGFEFVRATRTSASLSATPSILVTSRGGAEDRRRGREAGAYAYFVKSEFDEARLLETIRALIG